MIRKEHEQHFLHPNASDQVAHGGRDDAVNSFDQAPSAPKKQGKPQLRINTLLLGVGHGGFSLFSVKIAHHPQRFLPRPPRPRLLHGSWCVPADVRVLVENGRIPLLYLTGSKSPALASGGGGVDRPYSGVFDG